MHRRADSIRQSCSYLCLIWLRHTATMQMHGIAAGVFGRIQGTVYAYKKIGFMPALPQPQAHGNLKLATTCANRRCSNTLPQRLTHGTSLLKRTVSQQDAELLPADATDQISFGHALPAIARTSAAVPGHPLHGRTYH